MDLKMTEQFDLDRKIHTLKYSVPGMGLTAQEEHAAIYDALDKTAVTRKLFRKGTLEINENLATFERKMTWSLSLNLHSPGDLRFSDFMVVVNSLAKADDAVITQMTCIPFDPSTGYYLGKELRYGEPLEAFSADPDIQEQLDMGRTIDSSRLSTLLNCVAAEGQLPTWLDDETGKMLDTVVDFISWAESRCDQATVRMWCLNNSDLATFRNAIRMAVNQDFGEDRGICMNTQRNMLPLCGLATLEELEATLMERTGDSVQDAIAGIKLAQFIYSRMFRGDA